MLDYRSQLLRSLCFILTLVFLCVAQGYPGELENKVSPELLQGLQWRSIGPTVFGGRATDIACVPGDPDIIYQAHASAGLFKSTNGGITFESIFNDGNTLSIGAIALSPKNPDVIYVGTGEGNPRNTASFGDGIYKSLDGGKTWKHLGLKGTERFSRIIVNPLVPDIVFAAAMGHEWGSNKERGVYRSTDGGSTWKNILYKNETTGACDLRFDPKNPNIVYAGMYDYLRKPWLFRSGGPGSGLYRSSDGGDTWVKLTDPALENGLPGAGLIGRIGIGVSRSNPNVVYAMIESEEEGELWRSDDRGYTWKVVSYDRLINVRPMYFSDIRVDPIDENRIYALCRALYVSIDGGKNFQQVSSWSKMYGDHQALWIDPTKPSRLLTGSDGGLYVSNDRGKTWDYINTLPSTQAYHVGVDMADPYNVMGGFQDQRVWRGPNELRNVAGVKGGDWKKIMGGDGMYGEPDPRDPNIVYTTSNNGSISRVDMRTGEERRILPYDGANAPPYRFDWNNPVHISPSDPDVVYFGGNVLFKTTDGGYSWEIISPDLTTNDPEKMKISGGPFMGEKGGAETYCTIIAIAESPLDRKVIWVGTDDGNVQITRDGGETWTNVASNIRRLPANSWIPAIHASHHSAGTAYVAVDRHRLDDFAPYAYVTTDYGNSWKKISNGLRGYVHIVRDDPKEPNLLYAGTELGIFASFDRSKNWTDLRLGLPPLPVRDLKVHLRDNDLIIATHARGFYVLSDVTPLQELARAIGNKLALFKPMRATRFTPWGDDRGGLGDKVFVAENKPYGALISYYLAETPGHDEKVKLEILASTGKPIRALKGTIHAGINRVVWDLREDPPVYGPHVLPGDYTVRLSALGQIIAQSFNVRLDPRLKVSQEELIAQYHAESRLARMQHMANEALEQIQSVDEQISDLEKFLSEPEIKKQAGVVRKDLAALKDQILPTRVSFVPLRRALARLNLNRNISRIRGEVRNYTGRPTKAQAEWIVTLDKQLQQVLNELSSVLQSSLGELNARLSAAGIPHIIIKGKFSLK